MEADAPTPDMCAWWLKNHVCMPFEWRHVAELYEQEQNKQKGTDRK